MSELLHTAPLIVRRHREQPDDAAVGSYELFDPQWRLLGQAREEDRRGGARRRLGALVPWAPARRLTVFDVHDRPLLGMDRGSGRDARTTRVVWADGTPLGVIRRGAEGAEFDLVDSHGRALGRLDLGAPAGGPEAGPRPAERSRSTMERSHHRILDPAGQEVATLTREFLPNMPGRYPPHLLTYTLRPHRQTSAPLGALLLLTPMVTDIASPEDGD